MRSRPQPTPSNDTLMPSSNRRRIRLKSPVDRRGSRCTTRLSFGHLLASFVAVLCCGWLLAISDSVLRQQGAIGGGQISAGAGEGRAPPFPQSARLVAGVRPAPSTDHVLEFLLRLARMPAVDLRKILDGGGEKNPFHLDTLNLGQCPWRGQPDVTIDWLPKQTLSQPIEWFKSRSNNEHSTDQSDHPKAAVYYEHLSKAGGTSFCKLAQSNMPKKEVPSYYCMPSKPGKPDARVGSWSTNELVSYFKSKPHRLVSNEWEPFNLDFLSLQPTSEAELKKLPIDSVVIIFVTTIRNPINRLLSAYKFWGILNNPAKQKPSLETFLQRHGRRANRWKTLSDDFAGNVGRYNFATWKFSGGALPVSPIQMEAEKYLSKSSLESGGESKFSIEENIWRQPFETAVRSLSRFDLVIPMELLSDHTEPIHNILGWGNFEKSHVVNMGKIVNNDASSELSKEEYDALWESNTLDFVLYYWTCAVYLTRLYCADL